MRRAVGYTRVSTEKQARKDLSIPAQWEEIEKRAAADGAVLVARFEDRGISGKYIIDRPGISDLLEFVRAHRGQVDLVYCYSFKRMARNHEEAFFLRKRFRSAAVRLIGIVQPTTEDEIANVLLEGIYDSMSEYERRMLGRLVRRGARSALVQGRFPYPAKQAPFGRVVEWHGEGDRRHQVLAIDHGRAHVVRRIYELYLAGEGSKAIAARLTREGVRTPSGRSRVWHASGIDRILKCPTYYGAAIYRERDHGRETSHRPVAKEEIVNEHAWEAIVSKDMWTEAQRVRQSRRRRRGTSGHPTSGRIGLYKQLLRCCWCGGPMKINRGGKEPNWLYYYQCSTRAGNSAACQGISVRQEKLDDTLDEAVEGGLFTEEVVRALMEQTVQLARGSASADAEAIRATAEARVRELVDKVQSITQLAIDSSMDLKDAHTALRPLNEELRQAREALDALPEPQPVPRIEDLDPEAFLTAILESWHSKDIHVRRQALDRLIDKIELHPGEARISYAWKAEPASYTHHAPSGPPNAPWSFVVPSASLYALLG